MLKKLLATTALIAIGAAFVQSASADDSQIRSLVVEAKGNSAPDAAGLPLADAGKSKVKFVVKQDGGIATPIKTADANPDAGAEAAKPSTKFIIAPPDGIATPAGDTSADAGAPAADDGGAPAVDAQPADPVVPAAPAAPEAPAAAAAPADADQPATGAPIEQAAPAAPAAAPATAVVKNPKDLFHLLTDKGFGVEIVKKDGNGDLLYHVTIPGNAKDGYLLTVDGEHGKVKERKYISAYDYSQTFSYHAPATYAPSYGYSPASGSDDNCDFGSDYNAGY